MLDLPTTYNEADYEIITTDQLLNGEVRRRGLRVIGGNVSFDLWDWPPCIFTEEIGATADVADVGDRPQTKGVEATQVKLPL